MKKKVESNLKYKIMQSLMSVIRMYMYENSIRNIY